MKRIIAILTLGILLGLPLAGCETVRGVGKDMQKAGKWMEKEATK